MDLERRKRRSKEHCSKNETRDSTFLAQCAHDPIEQNEKESSSGGENQSGKAQHVWVGSDNDHVPVVIVVTVLADPYSS